jgi:hypothetical protein
MRQREHNLCLIGVRAPTHDLMSYEHRGYGEALATARAISPWLKLFEFILSLRRQPNEKNTARHTSDYSHLRNQG